MNRDEVKAVFKVISSVYPQFEVTSEKLDVWFRLLKDQNPAVVMRNTERFVLKSKFPPVIADLREPKLEYQTNILAEMEEWEKNAARKQ